MTPNQLQKFLDNHNLTQEGFARLLGASGRSGQRWASEAVPPAVATLVELLKRRPELLAVLDDIADRRIAMSP